MPNFVIGRPRGKDKEFVEHKRSISIFDLKFVYTLSKQTFDSWACSSGGFSLRWRRDQHDDEVYLELAERKPRNSQSTFNLVTTPCHYGGVRYWFECPRCEGRVAKLYENNDNFYCRKCLGLEYYSHTMNYRSLEPIVRRMRKLEGKEWKPEYSFYKGKMTKRAVRDEKLRWQVEVGTSYLLAKLGKH
jgi:hypothetical protein